MATIKSGNSADQLTVDPSRAARVTLYDTAGNALATLPVSLPAGVEIANDSGNPIPVSGTVGVSGTVPVSGTVALSGAVTVANPGLTDTQLRATPVPVSGQVTITDGSGPLTVDGTVNVANLPATQNVAGTVSVAGTVPTLAQRAAPLAVTATGVAGAAVTLTLPAAAGQYHYLTAIEITTYSAAARTGSATPVVVTSSNLPGALAWTLASAAAIGTVDRLAPVFAEPLRSSAVNTATTIVCPAMAGVIWRATALYYTAA